MSSNVAVLAHSADRGHGGRGRTTQAGSQWNALLDIDFKAMIQVQGRVHGLDRAPSRVVLRLSGQVSRNSRDGADSHHWFVDSAQPYPITHGLHRVPQNIKADAYIGNGGWRKGGNVGEHGDP